MICSLAHIYYRAKRLIFDCAKKVYFKKVFVILNGIRDITRVLALHGFLKLIALLVEKCGGN